MNLRLSLALAIALLPGLLSAEEKPAAPAEGTAEAVEPPKAPGQPAVKDLGEGNYELAGIRFNSETREIVVPAIVNLDQELLEYAIVNDKGATHEALLRTESRPFDLQVVLLLLRYQSFSKGLFEGFDRDAAAPEEGEVDLSAVPANARLSLSLRWKTKDGKENETSLESWIKDIRTGKPMPVGFWQFNGLPDPANYRGWRPEAETNTIGIFLSEFSPINYPMKGNRNDEVWTPNAEVMPAVETPVEIVLRPYEKPKKK